MSTQYSDNQDGTQRRLPSKTIMPLLSLQRHWLKSIIVFTLIAGIGLPTAWFKGAPGYYAEAVIQINFRYASNLRTVQETETNSDTQYRRFVQQQIRTMTRYKSVKSALETLGAQRSRWQLPDESERHAVQRLTWALSIKAVNDTYLVTIGLEHDEPDLIPLLVNAIVENYLEAARQEIFYGENIRLENLEARRKEMEASIEQLSLQLEERAQNLGLMTFEEGLQNPYDRILADMTSELSRARQKRVEAEAGLEAVEGKHAQLLKMSLDAEAQKLTDSDRSLADHRSDLYHRRAELVKTMSGLTPNHSGRQIAEREIEHINEEIARTTADKRAEMKAILEERRQAEMRTEIAEYEAKLDEARHIEQALEASIATRAREVDDFARFYNEGLGIKEKLDRSRHQLKLILDRTDEIKIEENAPGYVRLISFAEVPELPNSGGRKKLFGMFLIAATLLALALPLTLDFFDSSIRTPIDLHRIAGFAPSSWLPEIQNQESEILFNQQMERLAIAVFRDLDRHGQACAFFVTATLPGVGKTFVTSRLADHLQRLGVDTLVVSCDPANESDASAVAAWEDLEPSPTDNPATPGLIELMRGTAEIDQALVRRGPERADWIGFGNYEHADDIGNIVRLKEVLTEIRQGYRLALVDGPAILMSATAEAIAGICYGTLIVVASNDTPVKMLKRALSIIEHASPEVVGTVLHRAPLFKRGGYYRKLAQSLASYRADKAEVSNIDERTQDA